MKLVSLIIENIDVYDFLKQNRGQIELDHGNQTYRMLQVSLMMDEEAYVRNWLIKNGYMDEEKLPFEEIYEAYSGFIRNPEDPASEPFEPTGAVAQFREELRALFDKFKGDLKNPDFIKGVAEIMVNWKSLLRSQMEESKTCQCEEVHEGSCGYTHTADGKKLRTPGGTKGAVREKIRKYIRESLRNWFKKEDWVRIDTQGNIAGKCGTMPKGKATQRCLPRAKAKSLTKAQRRATARKKVRGSKKGKQFVRNTKKAKVRLKKK